MTERDDMQLVIKAFDEFSSIISKYKSSMGDIESSTSSASSKVEQEWKRIEDAQRRLGLTTRHEQMQIVQAFQTLKTSGVATAEELKAAQERVNSALGSTPSFIETVKTHWLSATAAITVATLALSKAWDMAGQVAQFEEQKTALNNLVATYNTSADQVIASLQRAADGTVSQMDSIGVANKGLLMGLNPAQLEQFTYAAQRLSGALGGDTVEAFEKLTQATAAGQERTLKQLGILVDLQGEYKKYGRELTEAERQTANFEAVSRALNAAIARMGPDADSAADAMERYSAFVKDLGISFGKALISVTSFVGGGLMWLSSGFAQLLGHITNVLSKIVGIGEMLPWVGEKFKGASEALKNFSQFEYGASEEAMRMSMEAIKVGTSIWKATEAVQKSVVPLKDNKNATAAAGQAAAQTADSYQQAEDKIMAVVLATAKLGASKEELMAIEALEYSMTGANIDQMERYTAALQAKAAKEESITREEERRKAALELSRLEQDNPYKKVDENSPYKPDLSGNQVGAIYTEYQTGLEALKTYNQQRLEELQAYNTAVLQQKVTAESDQSEIERQYRELSTAYAAAEADLTIAYAEKKRDFQINAAGQAFGAMSNIMQNLYVATGSKNKAMFEAMKGFAIAEAVINTAQGATKALAQGGFWGIAMAAAVVAAGMAKIQQIRSTNPGTSTSIGAGGSANPTYSGGSTTAYPVPERLETKEAKPTQNITVNIYNPLSEQNWQRVVEDNIVPALRDASDRNIKVSINNMG